MTAITGSSLCPCRQSNVIIACDLAVRCRAGRNAAMTELRTSSTAFLLNSFNPFRLVFCHFQSLAISFNEFQSFSVNFNQLRFLTFFALRKNSRQSVENRESAIVH